jgi:hypothetical protein
VPTILGMSFFKHVSPRVLWHEGHVFVGKARLPTCRFGV